MCVAQLTSVMFFAGPRMKVVPSASASTTSPSNHADQRGAAAQGQIDHRQQREIQNAGLRQIQRVLPFNISRTQNPPFEDMDRLRGPVGPWVA